MSFSQIILKQSFLEPLDEILRQIASDIASIAPKAILAIIVLAIALLVITLLNKVIGKILGLIKLDNLFKKLVKAKLPFSLSRFIIILVDVGILLIALFGISIYLFGPQATETIRHLFEYASRIFSVIVVVVISLLMFNVIADKVRTETRMRGYFLFLLLLIMTVMIVDLTSLSEPAKRALEQGLSIGVGIAIGVFAVWFFFHQYLDKAIRKSATGHGEKKSKK